MFNKYFDKLYCINLDRRPDRWEKVSETFSSLNIEGVTRYSAVDGASLDLTNTKYNPALLKGELGILETHLNLIKEAVNKKLNQLRSLTGGFDVKSGLSAIKTPDVSQFL